MEIKLVVSLDNELSRIADKLLEAITSLSNTNRTSHNTRNTFIISEKAKTKEETEFEAATTWEPTDADANADDKPTENQNIKVDEVIQALQKLAKAKGKTAAKELLTKYGAAKVSELKEDNYSGLIDEIGEVI